MSALADTNCFDRLSLSIQQLGKWSLRQQLSGTCTAFSCHSPQLMSEVILDWTYFWIQWPQQELPAARVSAKATTSSDSKPPAYMLRWQHADCTKSMLKLQLALHIMLIKACRVGLQVSKTFCKSGAKAKKLAGTSCAAAVVHVQDRLCVCSSNAQSLTTRLMHYLWRGNRSGVCVLPSSPG